jgi:hypothetical protein
VRITSHLMRSYKHAHIHPLWYSQVAITVSIERSNYFGIKLSRRVLPIFRIKLNTKGKIPSYLSSY